MIPFPSLTVSEHAAILAALAYYNAALASGTVPAAIADIATFQGHFPAVDTDQIDELCRRINANPLRLHSLFAARIVATACQNLEKILASDRATIDSTTGAQIEEIAAELSALTTFTPPAAPRLPSEIEIYAAYDDDFHDPITFSLYATHSPDHPDRLVKPIDRANPGGELHLYCFANQSAALAFIEGINNCQPDDRPCEIRTYSPSLTAVLIHYQASMGKGLHVNTDFLRMDLPEREATGLRPISPSELSTLLAALRYYQLGLERDDLPGDILDIASEADTRHPLTDDQIDGLCEDLNCGPDDNSPEAQKYREAAKRFKHRQGELEIDDFAAVSLGADDGAYVQAWVWVDEADTHPPEDSETP